MQSEACMPMSREFPSDLPDTCVVLVQRKSCRRFRRKAQRVRNRVCWHGSQRIMRIAFFSNLLSLSVSWQFNLLRDICCACNKHNHIKTPPSASVSQRQRALQFVCAASICGSFAFKASFSFFGRECHSHAGSTRFKLRVNHERGIPGRSWRIWHLNQSSLIAELPVAAHVSSGGMESRVCSGRQRHSSFPHQQMRSVLSERASTEPRCRK